MICRDCAQHDDHPDRCNACQNCEYGEKTLVESGATGGSRRPVQMKGCFSRDGGAAARDRAEILPNLSSKDPTSVAHGRKYLGGLSGSAEPLQELQIVPHHRLWDPGPIAGDDRARELLDSVAMPTQGPQQKLHHDTWVSAYVKAAPRIQRLMDIEAEDLKAVGSLEEVAKLQCTSTTGGWQGVPAMMERFDSWQAECRHMQETAATLAKGTPFDHNIPDSQGKPLPVRCVDGTRGQCSTLNCYLSDAVLKKAASHIRDRADQCDRVLAMLASEEKENGPALPEWHETAEQGGSLQFRSHVPNEQVLNELSAQGGEAEPSAHMADSGTGSGRSVDAAEAAELTAALRRDRRALETRLSRVELGGSTAAVNGWAPPQAAATTLAVGLVAAGVTLPLGSTARCRALCQQCPRARRAHVVGRDFLCNVR